MTDTAPQAGQVWKDKDPRGGPTFRVVAVDEGIGGFAHVIGLDGKRPRRIRTNRFPRYERIS